MDAELCVRPRRPQSCAGIVSLCGHCADVVAPVPHAKSEHRPERRLTIEATVRF
jgi:hypothetical protein